MFALSLCCHLAIFLIIARSQLLPVFQPDEAKVTYVDMVTLPVASPQSGTPAPPVEAAPKPPAAAAPTPVSPPAAMALPAAKPKLKVQAKVPTPPAPKQSIEKPASEAREFTERMAKLEQLAEEKRQAAVLERLRNKGGKVGMPGAKGTEAGSDYSSYVQSRVQDAINKVAASQTKSPPVIATIVIGPDGRIVDYHIEKSSGDPLFDETVTRAVTFAGRSLKPPPGGVQFTGKFRFKHEGVGSR